MLVTFAFPFWFLWAKTSEKELEKRSTVNCSVCSSHFSSPFSLPIYLIPVLGYYPSNLCTMRRVWLWESIGLRLMGWGFLSVPLQLPRVRVECMTPDSLRRRGHLRCRCQFSWCRLHLIPFFLVDFVQMFEHDSGVVRYIFILTGCFPIGQTYGWVEDYAIGLLTCDKQWTNTHLKTLYFQFSLCSSFLLYYLLEAVLRTWSSWPVASITRGMG
jgi:hypothetical protein